MDKDFKDVPLSESNVTLKLADIQKRYTQVAARASFRLPEPHECNQHTKKHYWNRASFLPAKKKKQQQTKEQTVTDTTNSAEADAKERTMPEPGSLPAMIPTPTTNRASPARSRLTNPAQLI